MSGKTTEEILQIMKERRSSGSESIEFTGGEPTIRKDIVFLLRSASEMGFKEIALSTNARMFSYRPFLEAAVNAGITRVSTTLDGGNEKMHDAITRTPGSFKQTVAGIDNLVRFGIPVTVNTVLFKLNVSNLEEIAEKLIELNVSSWGILDLIPDGNIRDIYKSSCLTLPEANQALQTIFNYKDRIRIQLFDFSPCVIPSYMLEGEDNISYFDAAGRDKAFDQLGYGQNRLTIKKDSVDDSHKIRLDICHKCSKTNECGGVWKDHYARYGEEDKEFVEKNYIK